MLAVSGTEMPDVANGRLNVVCSRKASAAASEESQSPGEDEELVGAQPADGVPGPHLLGEPRTHLAQQRVADLVAERVVDGLEPVEVDDQQRRARARRAPRAEGGAR